MTTIKGLRQPSAVKQRRLSPPQEHLIHLLYAAKERVVRRGDLADEIFDSADKNQKYKLLRLVHETRRSIQGTGWHIENKPGYGYCMRWLAKDAPEDDPETVELLRDIGGDIQAMRADQAMFSDQMLQILAQVVTVPTHMLLPASTWASELDEEILQTKGITGKLSVIAEREDIPAEAVMSRFRALKKAG